MRYNRKGRNKKNEKITLLWISVIVVLILSLCITVHKTGWDKVRSVTVYDKPLRWSEEYEIMLGKGSYLWNVKLNESDFKLEFPTVEKIEKLPSLPWFLRYKIEYVKPVAIYEGFLISPNFTYISKATRNDTLYPVVKELKEINRKSPIIESFMAKIPYFAHLFDTLYISENLIKGRIRSKNIYVLFLPAQEASYIDSMVILGFKHIRESGQNVKTLDLRFRGQIVLK